MSEEKLNDIARELQRLAELTDTPLLAPVPVVDGSVKLMLFGRTSGDTPDPDDPGFVRSIHHAAKPALYGDNRAAFSVELDERGVTILDQAMRGEMAPIARDLRPGLPGAAAGLPRQAQDRLGPHPGHHGQDLRARGAVHSRPDPEHGRQARSRTASSPSRPTPSCPRTKAARSPQRRDAAVARVRDMITDAFFESSVDPLRQAPDGWDKAAGIIKSFAPQRFAPLGVFSYKKTHYTRIGLEAARRRLLRAHHAQALDVSAGPPVRPVPRARPGARSAAGSSSQRQRRRPVVQAPQGSRACSAPTSTTSRCARSRATLDLRQRHQDAAARQEQAGRGGRVAVDSRRRAR